MKHRTPQRGRQRGAQDQPLRREQLRQHLAEVAARIFVEEGASSFHAAKLKAAERLGVADAKHLPSNDELEAAVLAYQNLFHRDRHSTVLRTLREAALQAMRFFDAYSPRLVGSVLSGTAQAHSDINLHVFCDSPERVELYLVDNKIPFERSNKRYFMSNGQPATVPTLGFVANDVAIDVAVFPANGLREAPRSTPNGEPIKRASLKAVAALLAEQAGGQDSSD